MTSPRLKGQEISLRMLKDGALISALDSIGTFNGNTMLEIKEDGFLGEPTNRFDEVLNGFGGDFEMQVTSSAWINFETAITDRATRRIPGTTFNVIRTDLYPNGDSAIYTYKDVHWGELPQSVGGRVEFVKVKANFKCSERPVQINALP